MVREETKQVDGFLSDAVFASLFHQWRTRIKKELAGQKAFSSCVSSPWVYWKWMEWEKKKADFPILFLSFVVSVSFYGRSCLAWWGCGSRRHSPRLRRCILRERAARSPRKGISSAACFRRALGEPWEPWSGQMSGPDTEKRTKRSLAPTHTMRPHTTPLGSINRETLRARPSSRGPAIWHATDAPPAADGAKRESRGFDHL